MQVIVGYGVIEYSTNQMYYKASLLLNCRWFETKRECTVGCGV